MNIIGPTPPNVPPGGSLSLNELLGQGNVSDANGSSSVIQTNAALLAELQQLLASQGAPSTGGAPGTDNQGDTVTDGRGAPAIDTPDAPMSVDDLIDLLRSIRSKSQDAQLNAAQTSIQSAQIKSQKNTENQLSKIKEWIDKSKAAEHKGLLGKIFGWIGKIVAVIAAVAAVAVAAVATVASVGGAGPLLALACVGLVAATISLADQISRECGGPEISIGKLVTFATSQFLQACGVPKEKAEEIGKLASALAIVACPGVLLVEPQLLSTVATGICQLAGASDATAGYVAMAVGIAAAVTVGIVMAVATAGSGAASSVVRVTNTAIGAAGQIAGGGFAVGTGVVTIEKAGIERQAQGAIADKKELEAAMIKLQKSMEEGREDLKKIIQEIEDSLSTVTQMINSAADSMSEMTANMGKQRQTV